MNNISEITYEQAKTIITDRTLILKPDYTYYAYNRNGTPISVIAYSVSNNKIKWHSCYTVPDERNKGTFSTLLKEATKICKKMYNYSFLADCTEYSYRIFEKNGYTVKAVKPYKNFTIYKMEAYNGETKD